MIQVHLQGRFPVSLYHTVTSHGWVSLSPWSWNVDKNELSRPERLKTGNLVLVSITQSDSRGFSLRINADKLEKQELEYILTVVKRWLSIDWDPKPAISAIAKLDSRVSGFINDGGGRFLRCSTFYEDFIKTICTINTNWTSTVRMADALVEKLGAGVFPSPREVVGCGEEFLRERIKLGFRARVVAETTARLLEEGYIDDIGDLINTNLTFGSLIGLPGIGQYSASHIMMLCHDFSRVPIDSEVTSYCKRHYGIDSQDIEPFFCKWGHYMALGYKLNQILLGKNES